MGARILCLIFLGVVLGLIEAEELNSAQMSVRFDGQVCTAELNKCSVTGDGNFGHAIGGGIKGEKGDKGDYGYPGLPGLTGPPGTCGDICPPIASDDSRRYDDRTPDGSEDRPAPWICKSRPDEFSTQDLIWVMKAQPFRVECKPTKATCLILDEDKIGKKWKVYYTASWWSKNGFGLHDLYEVSETQLRFLKERSDSVTQIIRFDYKYANASSDLKIAMLSWNDGIIAQNSSVSTPLQYDINRHFFKDSPDGLHYHTELQIIGSARSLPVVDFNVRSRYPSPDGTTIKIVASELCFN